jgi:hypothetical protein
MDIRNRLKTTSAAQGELYYWSKAGSPPVWSKYGFEYNSFDAESRTMMDYWHKVMRSAALAKPPLPPSDLELTIIRRDPALFNRLVQTTGVAQLVSWPTSTKHRVLSHGSIYAPRGSGQRTSENSLWTQKLLADTNPHRSEYSVPIAIKEAAELASLFKIAGGTLAQYVGGNYLNYKFGWQQFHRDVQTLTTIVKVIDSRILEIKSLRLKGGLRRNVALHSASSDSVQTNVIINSTYGTTIRARIRTTSRLKVRGSVRWYSKMYGILNSRPIPDFERAWRAVLDLEELDPTTTWGLLPFSWLVDYFINISEFLQGQEGADEVEPDDICIMRFCTTKVTETITSVSNFCTAVRNGTHTMTTKSRDVCYPGTFPIADTSLFSQSQYLILAALLARFSSR